MSHRLLALALVLISTARLLDERQQSSTGAISGVVIEGATKQPLGGAVVLLELDRLDAPATMLRPGPISQQITDEKGRFVFTSLPAAQYRVNANMPGYFEGGFGRSVSMREGTRIVLADRQWFDRADVQLWRPGAVAGRVVDEHGEPVVGIPVRVLRQVMVAGRPQIASGANTTTDDRGVYRIAGLAPGRYYVSVPSVQMTAPADALAAAVAKGNLGRSSTTGDPTLDVAGHRLVVGRFAIPSPSADGRARAYPPMFYPGATSLRDATTVELEFGVDRSGLDVRLEPVPASSVSGVVQGPENIVSQMTLRLLPAGSEELGLGAEAATALVGADGAFLFVNVPSGDYVIDARGTITEYESSAGSARYSLPTPPGARSTSGSAMSLQSGTPGTGMTTMGFGSDRFWARAPVSVGGRDISGLVIPLRPAVTLRGHYILEGTAPPPASMPAFIRAEPASGQASLGQPRNLISPRDQTTSFVVEGLLPGEYVLRFGSMGNAWVVKSIVSDGRDHTSTPFDASRGRDFTDVVVTLTDKIARIEGTVTSVSAGSPQAAVVIAFPVEREQWSNYGLTPPRIATGQVTNAGTFRITPLPAGDYFVIAVDQSQANGWHDPAFLQAAAGLASRVELAWGQTVTTSLRLTAVGTR